MFNYFSFILFFVSITYSTSEFSRVELSCEQIQAFVDGHNLRRERLAHSLVPGQPCASNMLYMVWDEELADKAATWAENGIFDHNPDQLIDSRRWDMVGENIYMSWVTSFDEGEVVPDIKAALDNWFNENEMYNFDPIAFDILGPIGHYTQMVWAETNHVGCGISQEKVGFTTCIFYVCNYGPTGNFFGKLPYETSDRKGYLLCKDDSCDRPYGDYCEPIV